MLASHSSPSHTPPQLRSITAAEGPRRGMAAGEEDDVEYDFEYSDDDEAEPDVEVRLCGCPGLNGGGKGS